MSQKSNAIVERILDELQHVIDHAKGEDNPALILAAATAQAMLVGIWHQTAEELADAVECLVADNIGRFSSAERSRLIELLRDKVNHIEHKFCS